MTSPSDDPPLETVDPKKRSVKYAAAQKPALWRRALWLVVSVPARIVNAMLGGVR